ncbi:SGNH/GDSL hydrolase family protein [Kitasatospora sp. MBT63]|uniref:SGNH/GDSL hydrolase family protein n=1 Tax=Kitasatospora sp. MBT63 TaxID=1444768 RepID=UPI0006912CE7|nr:SGNH/GDSL hydrolase family protein [Kitasatospora sp. MBT63]
MRSALPGRLRLLLAAVVFTASVLGLTGAPTASAAPAAQASDSRTPTHYLALGDSLAAGYQSTPDGGHVVGRGYAQDIAKVLGGRAAAAGQAFAFTDLGCPGESTATMIGGGCPYPHPYPGSQLAEAETYLRAHHDDRVLVTLDIGANDIGHCTAGGVIDVRCTLDGIATVRTGLATVLDRLRAAAGPHTRILGMNLYDPYLAAWLTGDQGRATALLSLPLAGLLNATIGAVDAAHGVPTADVARAFDTNALLPLVPLNGTRVPLDVARILQLTNMGRGDIHANDAGYQLIADTLLARL